MLCEVKVECVAHRRGTDSRWTIRLVFPNAVKDEAFQLYNIRRELRRDQPRYVDVKMEGTG